MARRKSAEVELLLPEDDQQPKGRKKLVEAEHTIKYSAPVPVTIEETSEDAELDLIDDDVIEAKPKRRVNSEREELRKKLSKNNITPGSELKLTIEKYSHSDVVDGRGGVFADTEHCQKYICNEAHITSEDYLDVARKFGPGLYRFTLRMKNQIVTAWDKRISTGAPTPIIQNVNPADPNSPQVIVQSDGQQTVMPSIKDIMKVQREALKEQLEMAKLMREAYGFAPEQLQQQPRTEEEVLAGAILKQPEIIENVVGSVIKRFGGSGKGEDEPWYAEVVKDAVKSGQLAQVVKVAIDSIFGGFKGLFPGGQDNGQAPMAETPIQTSGTVDSQRATDGRPDFAQEISQGNQALQPPNGEANREGGTLPAPTAEEQALQLMLDHCRRSIPPKIAFDRLIAYADLLNDQAPQYSIDGYISMFAAMPIDEALAFVKTQPNGEAVASLPHAKSWTEELQRLIKEAGQEGEDA